MEADVRPVLEAKLHEVRSLLAELTAPPDALGGVAYRNRNDRSGLAGERHAQAATFQNLTRQAADIERAIAKMDEGSYGVCEVCGTQIAAGRLEIRPWVVRCVECETS